MNQIVDELLRHVGADHEQVGRTERLNFVFLAGLIVVGQNGGMAFGQSTVTNLEAINQQIPSVDAFLGGQAALAFWDDIDDKEGDTYYVELVDHPVLGTRLVVQWNHGNFDGAGSTLKFQVHVLPNDQPTGTYAQYFYKIEGPATAAGASATIGYQDGDAGFGYLQYSYDLAGAVTDGTVLSLVILDPADLNGDGSVGATDLLGLLVNWGPCAKGCCLADLDLDGAVGASDLLILLVNWG